MHVNYSIPEKKLIIVPQRKSSTGQKIIINGAGQKIYRYLLSEADAMLIWND
jgi:hypothetical protein